MKKKKKQIEWKMLKIKTKPNDKSAENEEKNQFFIMLFCDE